MEKDQKFSNLLVYIHDHARLKQACSVNSASSADYTRGTGTSDSKWNEPEPESGVEWGRKSGSDSGSGVGITPPLQSSLHSRRSRSSISSQTNKRRRPTPPTDLQYVSCGVCPSDIPKHWNKCIITLHSGCKLLDFVHWKSTFLWVNLISHLFAPNKQNG